MTGLAITAWSAVSSHGVGAAALRPGAQAPDLRELLGGKGTKSFDRLTLLALAAVGELTDLPPDTAIALATSGSVRSIMDFSRQSLTAAKPTHVDPSLFPNTVMNRPASQCAIRYGLRGPNTTIGGGRAGFLQALGFGRHLIKVGRADRAVVGGVEEDAAGDPAAEGCAVFVVEPAGPAALADVLAVEFGVHDDKADSVGLTVARALDNAGVTADDVSVASASSVTDSVVLTGLFGDRVTVVPIAGLRGAAYAGFQVAEALQDKGIAVVNAMDRNGVTACAVLNVHGGGR